MKLGSEEAPILILSCGLWKQNLKGQSIGMILTTIYRHGSVWLKFKFQSNSVFQKISNKLTAKTAEYEQTEISKFVLRFQFRKPVLDKEEEYHPSDCQEWIRKHGQSSSRPQCPSDRCPPTYLLRNMNILIIVSDICLIIVSVRTCSQNKITGAIKIEGKPQALNGLCCVSVKL